MSDWSAFEFHVAGTIVYRAGKVKSVDPLDFEYKGPYWETEKDAAEYAARLTEEEK